VGACRIFNQESEVKTDYKTKRQRSINVRLAIDFEADEFGRVKMICKNWDESERYTFIRTCKRWRSPLAGFRSSAGIGSLVFDYDEKHVSDAECELMTDIVDLIGSLIDESQEAIAKGRENIKLHWQRMAEIPYKNHFPDLQDERKEEDCFVYLMRHANGLTKIGLSKYPQARERTLQAEDPRLHMIFYTAGTKETESRLHSIFHSARVRGEWFDLQEHHVDWIVFLLGNNTETNADEPA
jgi:hypothetical protein